MLVIYKSKNLKFFLFALIFNLCSKVGLAQHLHTRLEYYGNQLINKKINNSDEVIHAGFKPLLISLIKVKSIIDSVVVDNERDQIFSDKFKSRWIYRKIRSEDFVQFQKDNFTLKINPLFDLSLKKGESNNRTLFINTRGIEMKGDIGKRFSFYTSFYENQARFEPYITDYINKTLVVPGQGAAKKKENEIFDFSRAEAYFTLRVTPLFYIQAGHSKHYIGEGYRSMLFSDNTFCYPFIKFNVSFGKFEYTLLWNQYQSFTGAYYNYHQRKYGSISYLSWVPYSGFEISLFEGVMWPGNTVDNKNNFNLNFFNPLILSRTAIYGLDNEKNILLGLNSRLKIYKYALIFFQFALDKLDKNLSAENNFAYQVGIKHFDLFHDRFKNQSLFIQTEYNFIAPYTYSWKDPKQSWSHYNQPLAHPGGSGLKEVLGIVNYTIRDFSLRLQASYLVNSVDTASSNFGSDIFKPAIIQNGILSHTGNKPGQGIQNELIHLYSELSFLVNPVTDFRIFFGMHVRESKNTISQTNNRFFTFGIKTNINNYYYDF